MTHPSGHEKILAEVDLAGTEPRKWYSIWLDPIARNREVGMFNTYFFGSRKSNWNNRGNKLYTAKDRWEFDLEKKLILEYLPDCTEFNVVTPLTSLKEFFEVIGYDYKRRGYRNDRGHHS